MTEQEKEKIEQEKKDAQLKAKHDKDGTEQATPAKTEQAKQDAKALLDKETIAKLKETLRLIRLTEKTLRTENEKLKATIETGSSPSATIETNIVEKELTEEQKLENQAEQILKDATEINELFFNSASDEERDIVLDALDKKTPGMKDALKRVYTKMTRAGTGTPSPDIFASDLPVSEIFTDHSIRIIEQSLISMSQSFPLTDLINFEMVSNGVKELFYHDYGSTDNEKGYTDVKMEDFNGGGYQTGKVQYKVTKDLHAKFKTLNAVLNDITLSPGLFVSLVNHIESGIAIPFQETYYKEHITFLDTAASYDKEESFPNAASPKDKAKQLFEYLVTLETPSRSHLKYKPVGFSRNIRKKINTSDLVMLVNKKYAGDYKYELAAGTYQLGEIQLPVGEIRTVDFETIDADILTGTTTGFFKEKEVILIEKGVYNIIQHYSAQTHTKTPKLFSITHRYDRYGAYKRLDKFLGAFKTATS